MEEAQRILNDEVAEPVAPPNLAESSVVLAPPGAADVQDDPLPMCTWGDTASQGVEARIVQLPDG
eukprot:10852294-Alexandrium_andersonii.AAC.1